MKSKSVAAILAIFVGGLGIHNFYLGKILQGIIYLVFCWTCIPTIIALIEGILFIAMPEDEFNRKYNKR